jgi:hypothetical protein
MSASIQRASTSPKKPKPAKIPPPGRKLEFKEAVKYAMGKYRSTLERLAK